MSPCLEMQPMSAKKNFQSNNFGQWFKEIRTTRGLTMDDVGDRAGCTQSAISNLERGARNPSRDMVVRLVRALAHDDMSESGVIRLIDQGLVAAGFQPMGDNERDPAHDDLMEAGYSELSEEARKVIVTLVKQMRQK